MSDPSDLTRMQDGFVEHSKEILLDRGHMGPVGFVVTLHKHLDRLFESGYGVEFIDPKTACVRDPDDDAIATLIVDLSMSWKKLYHAVLTVFPQTQDVLPGLLAFGTEIQVDDPYKRLMRPFLMTTQLDQRDIIAEMMRQICDKASAFASVLHFEAWRRMVEPGESRDEISEDLGKDAKSVEILISSMETREFVRMITVPIHRAPQKKKQKKKQKRDDGKIEGFGESTEIIDRPDNNNELEGRLVRFLRPLGEAS
jgi:hypothetical protein